MEEALPGITKLSSAEEVGGRGEMSASGGGSGTTNGTNGGGSGGASTNGKFGHYNKNYLLLYHLTYRCILSSYSCSYT